MVINCNGNTETIYNYGELQNLIEKNLGSDVVNAINSFTVTKTEAEEIKSKPIEFVEEGIFHSQVEESKIVELLVKQVITDLQEQDYIKKNKRLDKFQPDEAVLTEIILNLSDGILNYFR